MKWLWLMLGLLPAWAGAATMTEIIYQDSDPGDPPYQSRILAYGDKLRLDYGVDKDDYTLFDRQAGKVYIVSHDNQRIIEIGAAKEPVVLPKGWRLKVANTAPQTRELKVNGQLCMEVRSSPLLPAESHLLADLRRALAANQATTWQQTPPEMRNACDLVTDGAKAGFEYEKGLPLLIRYGDGRSRTYRSHTAREVRPELFELPSYQHLILK